MCRWSMSTSAAPSSPSRRVPPASAPSTTPSRRGASRIVLVSAAFVDRERTYGLTCSPKTPSTSAQSPLRSPCLNVRRGARSARGCEPAIGDDQCGTALFGKTVCAREGHHDDVEGIETRVWGRKSPLAHRLRSRRRKQVVVTALPLSSQGVVCTAAKSAMLIKTHEVRHEAVSDFRSIGATDRRILLAAGDHHHVRLLEPSAKCRGGREAGGSVRHDAAIQLSVRHPAGADDRRGG